MSKDKPILILSNHTSLVTSVKFSSDDKSAYSGSASGPIIYWDLKNAKPSRIFMGHLREVNVLSVEDRFGCLLASSGSDTKVKLWDCRQKEAVATFKQHQSNVTAISFSPNSKFLLSGDSKGYVKLWDI